MSVRTRSGWREPPVRVHGAPLVSGRHAVGHCPDGRSHGRSNGRSHGRPNGRSHRGAVACRVAVGGGVRHGVGQGGAGGCCGGCGGCSRNWCALPQRHSHGRRGPAEAAPGGGGGGAGRRDDQHGVALGRAHPAGGGHDGLGGGLLSPPQQFSFRLPDLSPAPPLLPGDVAERDGDEDGDGHRHADRHPDDLLVDAAVVGACNTPTP